MDKIRDYALGAAGASILIHVLSGAWLRLTIGALVVAGGIYAYQKFEERLLK